MASVLEPVEDALYRAGRQSQKKLAPGPAPGQSLQLWTGTCFLCSWDFLGSPLDGQYLQPGAAARSGPNTRSTGKCRPVRPMASPGSPLPQRKADDTWNSNRSQRHTEKLFVFFSEIQIQLGALYFYLVSLAVPEVGFSLL